MTTASQKPALDQGAILFSITLFLSALLMFVMQPMIGKMLLPLVGGAPTGWLVAMMFFQMALLIGYFLAYALSLLPVRWHVFISIIVLAAGVIYLPFHLASELFNNFTPSASGVVGVLALTCLIPFVALATLSPTLQRLYVHTNFQAAKDPYFLFAASNLGSFIGLLAYPFIAEPLLGLGEQTQIWRALYVVLIGGVILCHVAAIFSAKMGGSEIQDIAIPSASRGVWKERGLWIVQAAIPSSLMLGFTSYVTTDAGSVPFFWVLPLAAYLLTFVIAFARRQIVSLSSLAIIHILAAVVGAWMSIFPYYGQATSLPSIIPAFFAFGVTALFMHMLLASQRPPARRLTEYYLCLALGGSLGGIFNAVIAPLIFPIALEFGVVVILSLLFNPHTTSKLPKKFKLMLNAFAVLSLLAVAIHLAFVNAVKPSWVTILLNAIILIGLVMNSITVRRAFVLTAVVFLAMSSITIITALHVERNFFGVMRVFESTRPFGVVRMLQHGTTMHGWQQLTPQNNNTPNSYYAVKGPLGDIMELRQPRNVALVGLGAGTSLCYEALGRRFTVYEIDPDIEDIAHEWFAYIRGCAPNVPIVIGDARMNIAKSTDIYNVIILDAFSSDAIPVHLLTREAIEDYMRHLDEKGVLAVHISNRFYDLRPILSAAARDLNLVVMERSYVAPPTLPLDTTSNWVLLARSMPDKEKYLERGWSEVKPTARRAWTDDFSDTLSILRMQ